MCLLDEGQIRIREAPRDGACLSQHDRPETVLEMSFEPHPFFAFRPEAVRRCGRIVKMHTADGLDSIVLCSITDLVPRSAANSLGSRPCLLVGRPWEDGPAWSFP